MPQTTRRDFFTGMALLGAASVLRGKTDSAPVSPNQPNLAPVFSGEGRQKAAKQLLDYFGQAAPQLLRPAEGVFAHSRIACSLPGAAYSTNLWDWDTYWTMRGLFRYAAISMNPAFRQQVAEHAIGSFRNFFDHQSDEGRIPMVLDVKNADPLHSVAKDRPKAQNQAKPIFGQMALLISDEVGSVDWLAQQFDKLLRFYASWAAGNQSAAGLFVWGNDVAIGNDNDPTTFARPDFSSANLLLECLFYQDLKAAAELAGRLKRPADQASLSAQAKTLGDNIQKHCWDPRDQFYYSVDVQCVDRRAELIKGVRPGMATTWNSMPLRIQAFTGFLPLWCGLATPDQAKALVQLHYLADNRFRGNAGLRTLSSRETMYSLEYSKGNPSNWLGPVWIVANYLVWKGFTNAGFLAEANDLADKTLRLLADDLIKNGSLNEYYNPDTGAAISHKGFMNWNLLVMEMM